jgi:hypothetical protein
MDATTSNSRDVSDAREDSMEISFTNSGELD